MIDNNHTEKIKNKILHFCEPKDVFRKIPLEELQNYLELFNIPQLQNVLNDEDLMQTVKLYFENDLNLSATSKSAFMHRNTLIYRLEKINNQIGFNLKKFEEARVFKNIMLINEILKEKLSEEKT